MKFDNLEKKEVSLRQYVEKYVVDHNGLLCSSLYDETLKPWTPEDIKPTDEFINIPYKIWDILNYENSGMTTGAYLAAQSYRFLVTKCDDAFRLAQRSFCGIRYIYELGKQNEEGYFPKTYGGIYSEEASTDQYLYAMKGMMAYRYIAPEEDLQIIKNMITKMTDFWVKRKYRRTYFGIKEMLWPLGRFPSLLLMAYKVSGEHKYIDEFKRLNEKEMVYLAPADSQLYCRINNDRPIEFSEYEKRKGNKVLFRAIGECAAMDIMELDECLQHSDVYKEYWLRSMKQAWYEGKLELTDNGLSQWMFLYDPETRQVSVPEPEYYSESDAMDWSFLRWVGGFLSPRSTMLARVGVNVAKWLPEENAGETLVTILEKISPDDMKQFIDPDGKQILDKHRYQCHEICVDAIVNWLWAYWQGRYERVVI